ncbi:SAV_915 family protein [Streptomyces aurantiacus]|uniref:SseB protein N-terminal domain-containing protein n=1 Tax=Streptomyces aurantiacus JA 4570 TaxID=1286094 RepID=S3ZQN1_9ACTN|nr:SAV_915 family protein [Streptomyces aurantiacus]EPH45548.1 hypothetical protein STRAU_1364 [Streptomyces aurantiacus JA 4570]
MTQQMVCGEDPEPSERGPAGPLFVPVRPGPAGCVARLFRTPFGGRTAVAFTTSQRLADELGARQRWIRLSEPALRALTEPLGVARVTVDPCLTPRTSGSSASSGSSGSSGSSSSGRVPVTPAPGLVLAAPRPVAASAAAAVAAADTARDTSRWRDWDPQAVGALRVTGAAALVGALTAWIG